MNENLIYIAENIDVEEYWPDEKPYVSVHSSQSPYKTVCFHSERPNIVLTKPDHWFTKEEVMYTQQELKRKDWVSFEESGVPPVGTMLMNFAGEKREVVLVCDDHVVCRTFEGETRYKAYYFNHWESYNLKPWEEKTDEEIAVEAMIDFAYKHNMVSTLYIRKFMQNLYKEIKSGRIKI